MDELRNITQAARSGKPVGQSNAPPEYMVRPAPEKICLLDAKGRIVCSSDKNSSTYLDELSLDPGKTVHDGFHVACDATNCAFSRTWEQAWNEHRAGLPIEWFALSTCTNTCFRLRLQRVDYACGVLFGEAVRDYADGSVLFVRDIGMTRRIDASSDPVRVTNAAIYQLRRSGDPSPSLIASLDERLRTITGRLLVSQETERKRIASELHDGLGQSLSLLKMEVEGLLETREEPGPESNFVDELGCIHNHVQRALEELRGVVRNLRPAIVDDVGLVTALELLCQELQGANESIDFRCRIEGNATGLPDELAVTVYRIAQEALHNVSQHSRASVATLSFFINDDGISFEVADNGVGIPEDLPTRRGLGLTTIRERAITLGGDHEIDSKPGAGCRVKVSWSAAAIQLLR